MAWTPRQTISAGRWPAAAGPGSPAAARSPAPPLTPPLRSLRLSAADVGSRSDPIRFDRSRSDQIRSRSRSRSGIRIRNLGLIRIQLLRRSGAVNVVVAFRAGRGSGGRAGVPPAGSRRALRAVRSPVASPRRRGPVPPAFRVRVGAALRHTKRSHREFTARPACQAPRKLTPLRH